MKVACLQFAPLVGDVDNNLNRADAVLNRAKDEDLEDLDLLVLPELAFTGYNFKSLQEISPFLEHAGSGISSLWARTTALKYNCTVALGYPEKVDVAQHWPTSPEYYSAAIIVNNDGETIANYRKNFLHSSDETWALESRDGFFNQQLPGLGNTAMGICMDLNPYRFEAPWNAFEFAYHILESDANVVIVTMSWFTLEERRQYSRMPQEPDLETLTYWVQRLEPLIRAERENEIIVIFCNRTGVEGDVVYAGTSAVLGVCAGEVNVYGILGRGVKELLVVDTACPPVAQLLHRPENSATPIEQAPPPFKESRSKTGDYTQARQATSLQLQPASRLGHQDGPVQANTRSQRAASLKLTIPEKPYQTTRSVRITEESPGVETPTAPSPTPPSLRPTLPFPLDVDQRGSPETQLSPMDGKYRVYGGHVSISHGQQTPSTPFFDDEPEPLSERYYWAPSSELVQSPLEPREISLMPQTPTFSSTLVLLPTNPENSSMLSPPPPSLLSRPASDDGAVRDSDGVAAEASGGSADLPKPEAQNNAAPPRPSSPKSRNASRSRQQNRRTSEAGMTEDLSAIGRRIEVMMQRPASSMADRSSSQQCDPTHGERPRSPKSRNASRTRTFEVIDPLSDERLEGNISRASIPIVASPSCFQMARPEDQLNFSRQSCKMPFQHGRNGSDVPRTPSRHGTPSRPDSRLASGSFRTVSRGRQPNSQPSYNITPEAIAAVNIERQRSLQSRSIEHNIIAANISPDDEIIAIEEIPSLHCQVHGLRTSPDQITTIRAATSDDEIVGPPGSSNAVARLPGSPGSIHSEGQARMVARAHLNSQPRNTESQPDPTTTTSDSSRTSSLIANDLSDILTSESTDTLPPTSGDSFGNLLSGESPATPLFEPTTPRAMKIFLDTDSMPDVPVSLSATSHDTGLAVLLGTEIVLPTDRPKSANW